MGVNVHFFVRMNTTRIQSDSLSPCSSILLENITPEFVQRKLFSANIILLILLSCVQGLDNTYKLTQVVFSHSVSRFIQ